MATVTYAPVGASVPNDTGAAATSKTVTFVPAGASIPNDAAAVGPPLGSLSLTGVGR
mgnify:CR=1 FL=1